MEIHNADCLSVLKTMDSDSVDSIVTDPPYGIGITDAGWDASLPNAGRPRDGFEDRGRPVDLLDRNDRPSG